jgi:glycosyltransferase involved in cell wall biosynthesis
MTRVSVGLPVYNGEKFLEKALQTLVDQTHADLEIVISDNSSTDSTSAICQSFASRDSRIRYFRQPVNHGGARNHTFVAEQATGEYFRWYSYDDWMAPTCIEECARVLDENPEVVLAWAHPTSVYEADARIEYDTKPEWDDSTPASRLRSLLTPRNGVTLLSWCYPIYGLVRRDALIRSLPMGAYYGSDNVIIASWSLDGQWRELPKGLAFCRRHPANSTSGRTVHEVARWMSPTMTPGRSLPAFRRAVGYVRAVATADLPLEERLKAGATALQWPFRDRHWGLLYWDLRILSAEVFGGGEARQRSTSQAEASS